MERHKRGRWGCIASRAPKNIPRQDRRLHCGWRAKILKQTCGATPQRDGGGGSASNTCRARQSKTEQEQQQEQEALGRQYCVGKERRLTACHHHTSATAPVDTIYERPTTGTTPNDTRQAGTFRLSCPALYLPFGVVTPGTLRSPCRLHRHHHTP